MTLPYPLDDELFIFSSHAWAYMDRRDGLTNLLTTRWVKGVEFFDLSVTSRHPIDSEDDAGLARELRDRVRVSDALLVTAGMFVLNRPWIKFEIDMALAFDRPIIPVIFNGQERVPKIARQFAWCDPVKWRGDSVREAILQFLPPHRREAFEARIARREAAAREAERQRRAATAAAYYARTFPPAQPPEPFLRPEALPSPFLPPANALAAYERSPFQTYGALEQALWPTDNPPPALPPIRRLGAFGRGSLG